jgi:Phospholipase_D-nuclease N-terminal
MPTKKKWSEFSTRSRRLLTVTALVEVVLLAAALIDLKRRPAEQVRGSKRMWTGLVFVNIVGPIAYFALGRRPRRGATSG